MPLRDPLAARLWVALFVVPGALGLGCRPRDTRGGGTEASAARPSSTVRGPSSGTLAAAQGAAPDAAVEEGVGPASVPASPRRAEGGAEGEVRVAAALNFATTILTETDWPPDVEDLDPSMRPPRRRRSTPPREPGAPLSTSRRLGYLRHGTTAAVIPVPIVNAACPEGWLELEAGGFVCGKALTYDLGDPRVTRAPHPPTRDAPLPYRYGAIAGDDTPVYRRVLSLVDRRKYEPWLGGGEGGEEGVTPRREARDPRGNPLVRTLSRGFIVALDREFQAAGARYWRTTGGFALPAERVLPMSPLVRPHGAWLARDAQANASPVQGTQANAEGIAAHGDGSVAFLAGKEPRVFAVELTGVTAGQGARRQTTAGFWVHDGQAFVVRPAVPDDLAPGEKWIDVDLTQQALVAYEGLKPVFAARVASGRHAPGDDPARDHATPTGTFRIREKHVTATMDANLAADGPYSIEDVPWVMYFEGSFALHGAFWHDQFGHPRSHGCINMSPLDARELFGWVEPRIPEGWHGVYAAEAGGGTRVVVHGATR